MGLDRESRVLLLSFVSLEVTAAVLLSVLATVLTTQEFIPRADASTRKEEAACDAKADRLLVGAIRWDNWRLDELHGEVLDEPALANRVPYFSQRIDGKLKFPGDLETVMAADVHYARAAGIDYFIFGYYVDTGSWGREKLAAQKLNRAFRSYQNLPDHAGVKFALSINWSFPKDDVAAVSEALIDAIRSGNYVTTQDERVPIFFFAPNVIAWINGLGGDEGASAALGEIKRRISTSTGRQVNAIALIFGPREDAEHAVGVGFDAISTYSTGAGRARGTQIPYRACVRLAENFWAMGRTLTAGFVPTVVMGWDYRPMLKRPSDFGGGRDPNGNWCAPATDEEWIEHIRNSKREAIENRNNSSFQSIIFYAWNEFSEGGWIAPTAGEGTRRLQVISRALCKSSSQDRVVLRWPVRLLSNACDVRSSPRSFSAAGPNCRVEKDALSMDWPCPPGLHAFEDRLRTPSGTEALLWSGSWWERLCAK